MSGFAVMPYTAVLDIALVWLVFKGDVRLLLAALPLY